jgi:hypothetical protein
VNILASVFFCVYVEEEIFRFEEIRGHIASELGRELSVNDITETMTGSKRNWRFVGI